VRCAPVDPHSPLQTRTRSAAYPPCTGTIYRWSVAGRQLSENLTNQRSTKTNKIPYKAEFHAISTVITTAIICTITHLNTQIFDDYASRSPAPQVRQPITKSLDRLSPIRASKRTKTYSP